MGAGIKSKENLRKSWNHREYPHKPWCQNLESLGYIFVADSVGLSSFRFS